MILTVIDIFSRYAWALPLKSKRGEEVKDLFVELLEEANPEIIQFDEGKEFYNLFFKRVTSEKQH
jgi:IS30 family transposase